MFLELTFHSCDPEFWRNNFVKTGTTHNGRSVIAVSGKHSIALAMKWPDAEHDGLLGFAIRRTGPDRRTEWLPSVLRFEGEQIHKGKLYDSIEAPVQSMIWSDFGISEDRKGIGLPAGSRFVYEVIPVRGTPTELKRMDDESVRVCISTEPEHEHGPDEPEVHFNRGLSDMQEYERLFGEGKNPNDDPEAMSWLARDLDTNIIKFKKRAADNPDLLLDVAAYHLEHEGVIDALVEVGSRARVSLDWGKEEQDPKNPGPNGPAYERLKNAGVFVHKRRHVNISHNKYVVLKSADGKPLSVLTGSTNFTNGGIATQSNQSVIVHNPELAQAYLDDFERVLKNDNSGLRSANKKGRVIDETLEVHFSPHSAKDRPDLDRMTELATKATSSRLFMTFRMTDKALVESVLDDSLPVFGVVDRAYHGEDNSGDRLIFDEAHSARPRIAACNAPLDDEPDEDALFVELKRDGYNPIVHHKILLLDWDHPNCVVVTGSANYSSNSTTHNDENSLIISGDMRLAEEYFIEFCRLFTHWRPRWLTERENHVHSQEHLASDGSWTKAWAEGGRIAEFLGVATAGGIAESTAPAVQPVGPAGVGRSGVRASLAGERIEHIVVLMLENRSFDHMLGYLPGVNGIQGKAHENYVDPQKPTKDGTFSAEKAVFFGIPEGDIPPPAKMKGIDTELYGGPNHSFPAASEQLYGDAWGPTGDDAKGATPETNNGFVKSYSAGLMRTYADWAKKDPDFVMPKAPPHDHLAAVMAAFTPEQLPVINGLAQDFCVCDNWFSEVPGPTEPNRLFMHAATSVGFVHNPWEYPIEARTIYEDIDEHGEKTWAFYSHDLSDASNFPALKGRVDRLHSFDKFARDLEKPDDFANYVFLCPRYSNSEDGFANSQHAPWDVRFGEHWIADVYEALRKSEIWEKTLLIVTYDEHGGFYDHVYPPEQYVLPPDNITSPTPYDQKHYGYMFNSKTGRPKPQYVFGFDRLGFRVPTVLISPWLEQGLVENRQMQHTSVLATVRKMWGLRDQPLTAREGQAQDFCDLFETRNSVRTDCPTTLVRPPLPELSLNEALDQPLSPVQKEVFVIVNHLDGHEHSGKLAPVPTTQREAARYIEERNQAHQRYHEARAGQYTVTTDEEGKFRWELKDKDGSTIAVSPTVFDSAQQTRASIERLRETAFGAFEECKSPKKTKK